jgi:hypothetical protein
LACRRTYVDKGSEQPPLIRRRVLHRQELRAGGFSTEGETLHEAK